MFHQTSSLAEAAGYSSKTYRLPLGEIIIVLGADGEVECIQSSGDGGRAMKVVLYRHPDQKRPPILPERTFVSIAECTQARSHARDLGLSSRDHCVQLDRIELRVCGRLPEDVVASERKACAAVELCAGHPLANAEWERFAKDHKKLFALRVELEIRKADRDKAK